MSWLDTVLDEASEMLDKALPLIGQDEQLKAQAGLDAVKAIKPLVEDIAPEVFGRALILATAGDYVGARDTVLNSPWSERIRLRREARIAAHEDSVDDMGMIWSAIAAVGFDRLQAALPFILAAIG